jgi:heme/copper-type cytochrome/quinol oxidase subunit 4
MNILTAIWKLLYVIFMCGKDEGYVKVGDVIFAMILATIIVMI